MDAREKCIDVLGRRGPIVHLIVVLVHVHDEDHGTRAQELLALVSDTNLSPVEGFAAGRPASTQAVCARHFLQLLIDRHDRLVTVRYAG
jgi:hypothetical protein